MSNGRYDGAIHLSLVASGVLLTDNLGIELEDLVDDYLTGTGVYNSGTYDDGRFEIDCLSPYNDIAATIQCLRNLRSLCHDVVSGISLVSSIWVEIPEINLVGILSKCGTYVTGNNDTTTMVIPIDQINFIGAR